MAVGSALSQLVGPGLAVTVSLKNIMELKTIVCKEDFYFCLLEMALKYLSLE